MNIFQFFSYVNMLPSSAAITKILLVDKRKKDLCGNECQAGFHKLSHSIKMKDTLKKYTPPQGNIKAHSQQDQKIGSFYTDISDIEKAALTALPKPCLMAKAIGQGTGTFLQTWKSNFTSLEVLQKAVREH